MAPNGNGFTRGLLIGALVGAGVALLYAPKSGKELRAGLRNKRQGLAEEAHEFVEAAKSKASEKASSVAEEGSRLKGAVKAGADAYKEERGRS
jgi:gas vesicle protein